MRNLERMLVLCPLQPEDVSRGPKTETKNDKQCNVFLMPASIGSVLKIRPKLCICFMCFLVAIFGFYHLTILSSPGFYRNELQSPSGWNDEQQQQCTPKNSVIFLKTHKTAGSTIQNIFMRYAENHGLLIALPTTNNYFGHPQPFIREFVPRLKPGYSYNILCHHARFNFHEMRHVVNGNATLVTILRDPAHLFESLYSYSKFNRHYNITLEDFAYGTNEAMAALNNHRLFKKFGRNQMLFDLGLDDRHFDETDIVWNYVQYLGRKFDLVMLVERMMESLVLLRHRLCWEDEDVIIFKHNVRMPFSKLNIEPDIEDGLREFNRADQILYEYFDRRLSEQIAEFGVERMKFEVESLEKKVKFWHDFCVEGEVESRNLDFSYKPFSDQVYGFKLRANMTDSTCRNLAKAELPYTAELRKQQLPYYSFRFTSLGKRKYLETS